MRRLSIILMVIGAACMLGVPFFLRIPGAIFFFAFGPFVFGLGYVLLKQSP